MTREFQQMLQLAAIGATGHSIDVDCTDIDWKKVIEVAKRQKVDCYLAYALKNNKNLPCPAEIRDPLIKEARTLVFSNAMHRSAIIQLLEEMEAAGIHAVLLKGYAICDCYALPVSRTSSDTDIWVDPKDEDRACDFMKKQGFTIEPRWKNGHHAVCYHPALGCVELHVRSWRMYGLARWMDLSISENRTCLSNLKMVSIIHLDILIISSSLRFI